MASPSSPQMPSLPSRPLANVKDGEGIDDPSEATKLLEERLQAYKHACGYIEEYISATEKMHANVSKEYEKVLKTVSSPLRENHQFDGRPGGIAELFDNIRSNTQSLQMSHLETAKSLKATVLPIFERLHQEIKNKSKELAKGAGAASKAVDKARESTQKHIGLLGQHSSASSIAGNAGNDPYVLHKGIRYRLNKQLQEETNARQDMLGVQNDFSQFETRVVRVFQEGLSHFQQAVNSDADQSKTYYAAIAEFAQTIPPTQEWDGFVQRNDTVLIDPNAPQRTLSTVTFPNRNHPSTHPLIEGSLERKSGMMRSWSTFFYAVTAAKYLHEFKTDDDLAKDPSPEMSLYLPDTLVGGCNGNEFTIKGKDAGKAKVVSKLSTEREFSFRAHTKQEAEMWWGLIRSVAGGDAETHSPSSPPPVAAQPVAAQPVAAPAPIDTTPTPASPVPASATTATAASPSAATATASAPSPVAASAEPTLPNVAPASRASAPGGTTNNPIPNP